jgi:hypothetical protein
MGSTNKPFTPRQRTQSFTKEESKLQDLAATDIMMEEEQKILNGGEIKKPLYQFKTLKKFTPSELPFNPHEYQQNDTVYLSVDKRQLTSSTLEMELENALT